MTHFPKPLLFLTKTCDFSNHIFLLPYPEFNAAGIVALDITYEGLLFMVLSKMMKKLLLLKTLRNLRLWCKNHNQYPIYDQNERKTFWSCAYLQYIACIREYPPPRPGVFLLLIFVGLHKLWMWQSGWTILCFGWCPYPEYCFVHGHKISFI